MITQIAMSADSIEVKDGIPKEIKILPLGVVDSKKGRFLVDDTSVDMIMQEFEERQLDLVIDYEHQTMLNVQAPAAGWIRSLHKGTDAIIAEVEWTDKAKGYLQAKEYRYLSPVINVRKDRRVTAIHSVALTNVPAINGMFAMCSDTAGLDDFVDKEDKMDLKELAALLGLPEDATEEQVRAALSEHKPEPLKEGDGSAPAEPPAAEAVANNTILGLLDLPQDARTEDVTAKIMALKTGDSSLLTRIQDLEGQIKGKAADEAVEAALKDGKITAAEKGWAKDYALKDPDGFKAFAEATPVRVPQGRLDLKDAKSQDQPDAGQTEILKNLGISKEDFDKFGAKEGTE